MIARLLSIGVVLAVLCGQALAAPTLFVTYFENRGNPELEPLKIGLADMMITDLSATPGLTVVERAQLTKLLDELKLQGTDKVDPSSVVARGKLLGAKWMLTGSYVELFERLTVDVRLVEVETGRIVTAKRSSGLPNEILLMEEELVGGLREALLALIAQSGADESSKPSSGSSGAAKAATPAGVGGGSPTRERAEGGAVQSVAVRADPLPGHQGYVAAPRQRLDAALRYSEGLLALDRRELTQARESFEVALAGDPEFELAQKALEALSL